MFPFLTICLTLILDSLNPVKVSMAVLILSMSIFLSIYFEMGTTWMPIILTMLFMGGIMIMFMMISAVSPNQKTLKIKNFLSVLFIVILILFCKFNESSENYSISEVKWLLSSNWSMMILIMIIMSYFFSFLKMISSNNTPLKSFLKC